MRGQTIPQQQQPAAGFELMQLDEEFDQRFAVVGARTQLKYEMSVTAIRFVDQRRGQRSLTQRSMASSSRSTARRDGPRFR
jgi:hypothetical protein